MSKLIVAQLPSSIEMHILKNCREDIFVSCFEEQEDQSVVKFPGHSTNVTKLQMGQNSRLDDGDQISILTYDFHLSVRAERTTLYMEKNFGRLVTFVSVFNSNEQEICLRNGQKFGAVVRLK